MATSKRGLGEAATASLRSRPKTLQVVENGEDSRPVGGLVAALASAAAPTETGTMTVRLAEVASHPDNPRAAMTDLEELGASIKAKGLVQPIVVVPAVEFLVAHPQHVEAVGAARWVSIAGHRRRAAAELVGLEELPALIRPDLADAESAAITLVIENLHRKDLAPLEEARAFAQLAAMKMPQRKIAKESGVSQSHISKRLALLKLPEAAQADLAAGTLSLVDAQSLTGLSSEDQVAAYERVKQHRWSVSSAVRDLAHMRAREQEEEAARQRIEAEGLRLIDPQAEFGSMSYKQSVYDDDEVAAARAAGTLVAAIRSGQVSYYTTAGAGEGELVEDHAARERREERERKAAMKGRGVACARLVAKRPSAKTATAALVRATLDERTSFAAALAMVYSWLGDSVGDKSATTAYAWRDSLRDADPGVRTWVAWAMTVAGAEERTRSRYLTWDSGVVEHLDSLIAEGYQPSEWEATRLAAARLAAADAAELPGQITVDDAAHACEEHNDPDCGECY